MSAAEEPEGETIRDPLLQGLPVGADLEPVSSDLEKGTSTPKSPQPGSSPGNGGSPRGVARFLKLLGPGLVTGASDDDPSGIATYSQVGAQFGYSVLWTALLTFPLMLAVQELCGRIALQTDAGLGTSLRRKFPTVLIGGCILALLAANVLNLGADLGAVAAGASLLTKGRVPELWLVLPVAILVLALQLFVSYRVMFNVFKWLTLALFAYVVTGILARPPAVTVLVATVVPHFEFNKAFLLALVAILGTTISPYLFFWQASSEVDKRRAVGLRGESRRPGVQRSELRGARIDIAVGMFFSQTVMYFIILTSATVLHANGKTDVSTAAQAAEALAPFLGPFAFVAFAVGLIGTGLLAIPILSASGAYAVKEFFGFKGTLGNQPWYRPTFYLLIVAATILGGLINFLHVDPVQALFYAAAFNGLVAPPLMVFIALLGSDRKYMGDKASGHLSRILVWIATAAMGAAAVALIVSLLPLP